MQFRGLKLVVYAFRVNVGIHHFALYRLYIIYKRAFLQEAGNSFYKRGIHARFMLKVCSSKEKLFSFKTKAFGYFLMFTFSSICF